MIEKLFIVITLIISLNFISGVLFKRYFKIDWNNNTLNLLQLLISIFCLVYQTYYWLTKYNLV